MSIKLSTIRKIFFFISIAGFFLGMFIECKLITSLLSLFPFYQILLYSFLFCFVGWLVRDSLILYGSVLNNKKEFTDAIKEAFKETGVILLDDQGNDICLKDEDKNNEQQ